MTDGQFVSMRAGRNFALQVKFVAEDKELGNFMIIPTEVFDDMVARINGEEA